MLLLLRSNSNTLELSNHVDCGYELGYRGNQRDDNSIRATGKLPWVLAAPAVGNNEIRTFKPNTTVAGNDREFRTRGEATAKLAASLSSLDFWATTQKRNDGEKTRKNCCNILLSS